MAHELIPDQDNAFLEIGRIIEESFYKRESKGFDIGNMKIDLVMREDGSTLIGEIKKSSSYEKSAIMQLSFYLMKLEESGVNAKGEILIPKERKRIPVRLTKEVEDELKNAFEDIERIIALEKPLNKQRIKFCTHCAYKEFCWS
jgi:CRISPR-associated exonuclease Cas4